MPRVKRGVGHVKRRKNILKRVKGFEGGRKKLLKLAKTADTKAGAHAYRDRRNKKRLIRRLWQVKINASARSHGMTYSTLIGSLAKNNILLDRKILASLAEHKPAVFDKIIKKISS
jgi:large subunit ribosomal protein L20